LTICGRCERATQDAGGQMLDVAPSVPARALCDAEHIGHLDAPAERVRSEIPPKTRREVTRRDHGRCRVPGCGGSKWLEIHHIIPRSQGGAHDAWNLLLLCGPHHRAHHEGKLLIRGRAPDQLVFEHCDGTRYGASADHDVFAQVRSALTNAGYKRLAADRAISIVSARLGTRVEIEAALRAALVECAAAP
jgi:hypothetical protein